MFLFLNPFFRSPARPPDALRPRCGGRGDPGHLPGLRLPHTEQHLAERWGKIYKKVSFSRICCSEKGQLERRHGFCRRRRRRPPFQIAPAIRKRETVGRSVGQWRKLCRKEKGKKGNLLFGKRELPYAPRAVPASRHKRGKGGGLVFHISLVMAFTTARRRRPLPLPPPLPLRYGGGTELTNARL